MKNSTPYSIKKILLTNLITLFVITLVVLFFFTIISGNMVTKPYKQELSRTKNLYGDYLLRDMDILSGQVLDICYNNTSFSALSIKNSVSAGEVSSLYSLNNLINSLSGTYSSFYIFSYTGSVSLLGRGSLYSSNDQPFLTASQADIKKYYKENPDALKSWNIIAGEKGTNLTYCANKHGLYLCAFIDLNRFSIPYYITDITTIFFNDDGLVAGEQNASKLGIDFTEIKSGSKRSLFKSYEIETAALPKLDLNMGFIIPVSYLNNYRMLLLVSILLITLTYVISSIFILRNINKVIIYPMAKIDDALSDLTEENASLESVKEKLLKPDSDAVNIIEYNRINTSIVDLMDRINTLNLEKHRELFEKDHATLQFLQLQTNSHFLANCLKSLYSMLEAKEYQKMERMILGFSAHIRYIFKDNLSFVTLKEELSEVNDYYEIISLDRTTPLFLDITVPEELLSCKVPSLMVQTFLENTAKYNKSTDKMIMFSLNISQVENADTPTLQIYMSDNGVGYSEEFLDKINGEDVSKFVSKRVGISNLKHRISLLYKENYSFSFYNSTVNGGACAVFYVPIIREEA